MPDPHDNAKKTGDVHPPDVEAEPLEGMTDAVGADGTPRDRGKATESGQAASRPGRGNRKAGVLKDKGDPTGGNDGNTRDSGENSSGS